VDVGATDTVCARRAPRAPAGTRLPLPFEGRCWLALRRSVRAGSPRGNVPLPASRRQLPGVDRPFFELVHRLPTSGRPWLRA